MSNLVFVDSSSDEEDSNDGVKDDYEDVTQRFPPLYKTDVRGNEVVWKIWTQGNLIYNTHGVVGGKMRDPVCRKCEATRKGMKNERSSEEQASFEADSRWRKQLENGYKPSPKDKQGVALYNKVAKEKKDQGGTNHKKSESNRPTNKNKDGVDKHIVDIVFRDGSIMKAHPFADYKHKIDFSKKPFVQPKFDGVRCIANVEKQPDGSFKGVMTTSSGKQFVFLKHIKDALVSVLKGKFKDLILDGECYAHQVFGKDGEELDYATRFNVITGACRSVREEPHELESQMQLHIFDIRDKTMPQYKRFELLDELFKSIDVSLPLVKAPVYEINSEDEVYEYHDKFFQDNYEGVMIRNREAVYATRRTPDIQKYKMFTDEECKIVGAKSGKGTEKGAVVWVCKYKNGQRFECRPRGSFEERRELFSKAKEYFGKMLTVKYQALTAPVESGGVPRFPTGVAIRDYE